MTVSISTSSYEFSHGKKPKGCGTWAFLIGKEQFWFNNMMYSEAKKQAVKQAKELNIFSIKVES